jgi:hypothetical protein
VNATQAPIEGTDVASRRILTLAIVAMLALVVWGLTRTLPVVGAAPALSPVEGAVLETGRRVLHGENPYPDPLTDRAVAFLYPPLAPALLAAAFPLTSSLTAPRAVSLLAVLGTAAVLFAHVRRRSGWRAGILTGLAAIAVVNTFCGYFFLARVDAIAAFFLVAALATGARAVNTPSAGLAITAGVLTGLAVLCKQTAVAAAAGIAFALYRSAGERAEGQRAVARFLVSLALAAGTVLLTLHFASGGWSTKFLLMAGSHPFQGRELGDAIDRLLSVDAFLLLTLAIFGFRREEVAWNVTMVLTIGLSIVTAAKWGGLTTALAPVFLLWLGMAGVERRGARATDATLRLVSAFLALFLPLALYGVKVPAWGAADTGPIVEERLTRTPATLEALRGHPGPLLVNGYQELPLLAGRRVDDDLHAALECDLAGYPVLTRITERIGKRGYALFAGSLEDLTARAAEVREKRPETAARLEACARALAEHYVDATPPQCLTPLRVPKP